MSELVMLATAAAMAILGTVAFRRIARATGAVAEAAHDRWHTGLPVPRLSGPPLLLALALWVPLDTLLVLAGFCVVGVLDDYKALHAGTKAALLLLPSAGASYVTGELWTGPACWIAANALNMLDHADGIAASACAGSLLVVGGPLGVSGAGASLGFLTLNWPPARVFLGDGGSLMLGALLVLAWWQHGPLATLAGIAIPLLDVGLVVTRRIRRRRPPWIGGTDHSGHELLRLGLDPQLVPLVYGFGAVGLSLLALLR